MFASKVKSIRGIESVENIFWKKVLETWTMLNNNNVTEVKLTQPIFNKKTANIPGYTIVQQTMHLERHIMG